MQKKILAIVMTLSVMFSMCAVSVSAEGNYTPIAEGTHNGHTYQVFDEIMSWSDAKEYCESIGGHLATITSEEENSYLMSLLPENSGYMIGMHRDYTGYEEWVTGEPVGYSNWAPGQPDNLGGHQPNCILCNYNDGGFGIKPHLWDDGNDNTYGFICEWDYILSSSESKAGAGNTHNGHTYQVFDESLTWEESRAYCSELGGHLVTITSEEEQHFIETLLEEGQKKQYWIGMRTAGGPTWITGETYQYSNWDRGEPNNQHKSSSDEDYVHIYNVANPAIWGSERFKWNDMFGDNTFPGEEDHFALKYVGFICEWDYVRSSFGSEISEWASNEIEQAYDKKLIPESLVGADLTQPITRAEFAAVSVKAYELMANTTALPAVNNPFTDTKDVEVLKAYNTGITTGVSATEFAPDTLLNREQAATMLTRVFKRATIKGWTIETDAQFELNYNKPTAFADDDKISDWAKDSVYFMASNGIINGVGDNKFAPQNTTSEEEATGYANATREQALIIATRMVENLK